MPVSRRRRGRAASRAARSGNLAISTKRKKTNKLYLAASVVIAVLVITSFAFASFAGGGGGSAQGGSERDYVDGVGEQFSILFSSHIPEGAQASYNSQPATSGEHWSAPVRCGFYEEQLPEELMVHNLEHGNIVVSYNFVLETDISALRDTFNNIGLSRVWGVARYYDQIPSGSVALSAWGVMDVFPGIDPDRMSRFFDAYAGGLGPERFTC